MSKELQFAIFCIEEYSQYKKKTGKETLDIFNSYSVLDYIIEFYEALHTTGVKYIMSDIDLYINSRKKLNA